MIERVAIGESFGFGDLSNEYEYVNVLSFRCLEGEKKGCLEGERVVQYFLETWRRVCIYMSICVYVCVCLTSVMDVEDRAKAKVKIYQKTPPVLFICVSVRVFIFCVIVYILWLKSFC